MINFTREFIVGAIITPIREKVEHAPIQLFLIDVGNTSLEYRRNIA
jgi:hypothetical protein